MQILLGTNETIIRINSQSIKIDFIQQFIYKQFIDTTVVHNSITIPSSFDDLHHRIFLLKWLYGLYSKKTSNQFLELKHTLVKRAHKQIRIEIKEKIIYKIYYSLIDKDNLEVKVFPKNNTINDLFISIFKKNIKIINQTKLTINYSEPKTKEILKKVLLAEENIFSNHQHIFNKEDMKNFLFENEILKPTEQQSTFGLFHFTAGKTDKTMLKKQYKKLAKEFHPDRVSDQSSETIDLYTKKFQNIVFTYELLLKKAS